MALFPPKVDPLPPKAKEPPSSLGDGGILLISEEEDWKVDVFLEEAWINTLQNSQVGRDGSTRNTIKQLPRGSTKVTPSPSVQTKARGVSQDSTQNKGVASTAGHTLPTSKGFTINSPPSAGNKLRQGATI